MTQYIDPTLLGIVPPMDLGRGSTDLLPASPPSGGISLFPLKLRVPAGHFGRSRSDLLPDTIRRHDAVDLLAPIGTPVFAAQSGRVVTASSGHVRIEHTEGFRFITAYDEIRNPRITLYQKNAGGAFILDTNGRPIVDRVLNGSEMVDQIVRQGERIAEVKDFGGDDDHLHFEIRYPFANAGNSKGITLAVDATWALYAWEKKLYRNRGAGRNEVRSARIQEMSEIVRGRILRFLSIRVPEFNRPIYFPLGHLDEEDKSMVETLRMAFFSGKAVTLVWRESLFFNQIEFDFASDEKVPILAEVVVTG